MTETLLALGSLSPAEEEVVGALLAVSRVFVGVAARSLNELDEDVTIPQFRTCTSTCWASAARMRGGESGGSCSTRSTHTRALTRARTASHSAPRTRRCLTR